MFALIPRVRVNYNLLDVFRALFTFSTDEKGRIQVRRKLSSFMGVEDVLLTSSGRCSLFMIFRYLPQKKVFIPDYTCMVVVEAALLAEKEIHFVETSNNTFNADRYEDVDNDSIVVATHQYGLPCDIERIVEQSHQKGAVVVEDCAAAFGSRVNKQLVGTFGDYAAFSFDPSKLINVPNKGGFVIAKDVSDLSKIEKCTPVQTNDFQYKLNSLKEGCIYCLLKNKWVYRVFHYLTMGRKKRMQLSEHTTPSTILDSYYTHGFSEWQAVFVNKQLDNINKILERRRSLFEKYDKAISNPLLEKPVYDKDAVCIRYTIRVKDKANVYTSCLNKGIDMGFSFNHIGAPNERIKAHKIASQILNIPYYYHLSDREAQKVIDVLNNLR